MNVLILDDEKEIVDLLEVYLKNENYNVYKFYTSEDAIKCIDTVNLDIAILDVMIQGKNGFEICKYIRENKTNNIIEINGLIIDKDEHKCLLYEKEVDLTPTEFEILLYLANNRGKVISSEELFEKVWKEKYLDSNNTVMVHIRRIREKLHEDSKNPKFIKTVWGVGYKIEN